MYFFFPNFVFHSIQYLDISNALFCLKVLAHTPKKAGTWEPSYHLFWGGKPQKYTQNTLKVTFWKGNESPQKIQKNSLNIKSCHKKCSAKIVIKSFHQKLSVRSCLLQRPKNPYSKLALLSGKILRVRKIFVCCINCSEQPNLPGLFDKNRFNTVWNTSAFTSV